jgi:Zn-dependent peptidase ImmA (M78 family)
MKVTRLDLDGTGSPEGLVAKILKAEPTLSYPIPIEDLAAALDIEEIASLDTEAFEGGLLMRPHRSSGIILVNKAAPSGRRRFTIGHELGHFCILSHKPIEGDRFLCSRDDMRQWSVSEKDTYARMEMEANKFSALLLMPPPLLRKYMTKLGDPDLLNILAIHEDFDVSKDAAARSYAQYHDQPIAIAVVRDGKVLRIYQHIKFPRLSVLPNSDVPSASCYWRVSKSRTLPTELSEVPAGQWLESNWGQPMPELFEQVLHQRLGYALILLWPELTKEEDEYDPDENRTSKERLADRRARWVSDGRTRR